MINLNYIASLEKIDACMKEHMVFLNACYRERLFIVSGRKVPRTGGIILAQGSSKEAVEALMRTIHLWRTGWPSLRSSSFRHRSHFRTSRGFLKSR
ncbi:MAG: YciI family protein [Cyclobacteriaceae bacterium]